MRYSNVAVVMVPLFAAVQCADLVYWVDKSCPIDIGLYIKDSISAAGLAYTHAGDMSDSAFDAVYQIIFKDHRSGATYNKVRSMYFPSHKALRFRYTRQWLALVEEEKRRWLTSLDAQVFWAR